MVLINTQDNYTLAPEFTEGVGKGNYPIVVLTKSDGSSLVEVLDKYYGQTDIHARLDVEGSAVELQQQEQTEVEVSSEGSIPTKKDKPKPDSHGMLRVCVQYHESENFIFFSSMAAMKINLTNMHAHDWC